MPAPELPKLPAEKLWAALDTARTGDPDTLLVCASERIAQAFLDDDLARHQVAGRRAWRSAPIVPVDRFLREAYERAALTAAVGGRVLPAVLESSQERALWRSIVENTAPAKLLRDGEAARLAAGAWRLARDWRLDLPLHAHGNADVEQFNRWAARFHHRLEDLQAIDAAGLPLALAALAREGLAQFQPKLVFAGFDELTPALADLLETLTPLGVTIFSTSVASRAARMHRVAAADAERELRAAAAWARAALDGGAARIGIVVPNLGVRRAALQRVFAETLPAHAFSIALGEPLAEFSIVQCALRLLSLQAGELALDDLTALLLSPYWDGDDAQRMARARVDLRLREDGFLHAGLATLAALAEKIQEPAFADFCRGLLMRRANRGERLAPAAWAQRFADWLAAAGWPGMRAHDAREQEIRHRWIEVLGEFGALGTVLPALSLAVALSHLREVAERTLFHERAPAPVHVRAPRDSAGLSFDRLWVMGLDDQHWPPPARPNPLIPFLLQRERGFPRASAARELADAAQLTALWMTAADEVVFSHALHEEDRELQASPLIPDAPLLPLEVAEHPQIWTNIFDSRRLEVLNDSTGLPPAGGALRGGTRLFADQAKCPFRAYAHHRLDARTVPEPVFGPDARDRGILVHDALHDLWQLLRRQSALLALNNEEQAARAGEAVERAVHALARKAPQRLGPAMAQLERLRLAPLLNRWLNIERERPPFEVAEIEGRAPGSREEPRVSDVQGIAVRMRPDRIDRLPDGGALVIDYKTGEANPSPWEDERSDEPQLLLYALDRANSAGVAFAHVRPRKMGLRGIGATEGIAEDIDPVTSWSTVLDEWRRQIALLGEEIRAGFAGVLPKTPQVCERCDLHAFCRVREIRAGSDDDAPEDAS